MFLGLVATPLLATPMEMPRAPRPPIAAAPAQSIDSNVRHDVVARLSDALRNNYVFPDIGEKAAEKVGASLAAGEYDQLSDASSFAARLSSDVAAIAHDNTCRSSRRVLHPVRRRVRAATCRRLRNRGWLAQTS
jgi:hypothetical protein